MSELIIENSKGLQINILGKSFKAESNLTLGSPALLLENFLKEKNIDVNIWDPIVDGNFDKFNKKYLWDQNHNYFLLRQNTMILITSLFSWVNSNRSLAICFC